MLVAIEFEILENNETANGTDVYYDSRDDFDKYVPPILRLVLVFIGLSANIIVATIVSGNRSMHTETNCYVFSIIFSDFVVLLHILPNILRRWFEFDLHVNGDYVACMTLEASILTIVMFALERYVALGPLRSKANKAFGFSNGMKSVLIIWFMAATLPAMELNLDLHFLPDTQAFVFLISTTIFLALPTLVILILAAFMLVDNRDLKNTVHHDVSKVFVALTVVFYVSMAPYRMVSLVRFMAPRFCCSQTILNSSYLIVELSAAVNPILYGFVSDHFRTGFKETLRSFCTSNRQSDDPNL